MAAAPAKQAPVFKAPDAVTLLKSDHKQVKEWFADLKRQTHPRKNNGSSSTFAMH